MVISSAVRQVIFPTDPQLVFTFLISKPSDDHNEIDSLVISAENLGESEYVFIDDVWNMESKSSNFLSYDEWAGITV